MATGISVTTRRLSAFSKEGPLSPSAIPEFELLPKPLAEESIPVGQFVSKGSKHTPSALEDRDYDDVGTRWYKDVILVDASTGRFISSLGGVLLVKQPAEGQEVGTIEAPQQQVRLLKDADAALKKATSDEETKKWLKDQSGDVGFVTATRVVVNASYKRARLVDVGNDNFEVHREVGGEGQGGKRRSSVLEVDTGSKKDVVGVVVRQVKVEGEKVTLGDEMGAEFWN